ncbi:putative reverse transcriptase domain-containing protein [Tanacetum coccineum]
MKVSDGGPYYCLAWSGFDLWVETDYERLDLLVVFTGDIYGDHDVSCGGIVGFKHRHNVVRDTIVDICSWSGISASKKVDIGLGRGRDKPLRPADMLLYSWDGGLDVCVDLTGSSPLTQTGMVDFVSGRAVIEVAQHKHVKYEAKVFARDIYRDHVVSCAGIIGIKHRRNVVHDTLVDICYRFGISAGREVDIGLDGGRDKPLRPADILLYSWDGGLDVCVDLTGSSPLTQTGMVDFVPGRAIIDVAQRKRSKYMDRCAAIGYGFLTFSFSSLGELEVDVVILLKRIRKFSITQDIGARAAIHIFNRIGYAIAKGVGAQILILVDICFRSGISAGKEVDIGLGRGCDKPIRPTNMLLYSWDEGLDVCVDFTGSSPLTQTGMVDFVPGSAVTDAAHRKRVKYEAKCANIGYGFLPFSFSSLGELEKDAVNLLKRIRKFSVTQDIGARVAVHIFNKIGFAIAKGVGAQLTMNVFTGDIYGDHVVSCAGIIGIKHRHNAVRDTLVDICFRSGISAGKEVDIGLGGGSTSPLTPNGMTDFRLALGSGCTLLCCAAQYERIRKFSIAQDIRARAAIHIFNMISFAIAKGVEAQIVSRLPSTCIDSIQSTCRGGNFRFCFVEVLTLVQVLGCCDRGLRCIWLCGECFCTHTFSKNCKHAGGVVVPAPCFEEVAIIGIPVPPRPDLCMVDSTSPGTLRTDSEAFVDGVVSQVVHSLGVESICFDINLLSRVFLKKLRIVKCISPRLRLGFAKLFCGALENVLVNPRDLSVWVQLLILPCCVLSTFVPTNRAQRRSGERERCQFESISRAILRWKDPVDRLGLVSDRLAELTPSFSGVKKSNKHDEANVVQCKRKLGDGHFTAAIKVLTSSGVAPSTPDTLHELEAKHPYAPPLYLSSSSLGVDALSVHKDLVLNRIRSFPKGTSCGRDGLRAQHLMDILGGAASAVADDLLGSITGVVNLFLSGKCPSQLGEYIASAPLTPLVKPGGGIRPIAVGTVWRRLVSKVASSSIGNSMNTYLHDFQFGVGIPGGCEAVVHSVNRLIESKGNEVGLSMLLVDFKNAFNLVDRGVLLEETRVRCPSISPWVEFCYARPARLYYDDSVLWSCQGVQQGDPLGPLLFALALHPLVQTINQSCELTLQAWYLDDGTIVGDTLMVAKALDIIKTDGPARGLFLNVDKTELFWPVEDPRSRAEGVFPINISRPLDGVKLLGGSVSLDEGFCWDLALKMVSKTISLMEAIHKLHNPQRELFFLRNYVGVAKLSYALRTCSIFYLLEAQVQFDHALRASLEKIVTTSGPAGDIGKYALLASRLQTSALQVKILMKTVIESEGSSFKHALDAFNITCNVDVLSVITCTSAPQMMKNLAKCYFRVIEKGLISKLSVPMLFEGSLCPSCNAHRMDQWGDHAVHCSSEVGVTFRHNLVRDILVDMCSKVGIMVRKEAPMGFLSEDGNDLRPANLLLFNWLQGKDACFDVTCISPFAGMGASSWAPGIALHNAVEKKKSKYASICEENGYEFIPFAFSTFEEFDTEALGTLSRIKSIFISHSNNAKRCIYLS